MALSATLNTGPLMLYFGQELGVNPTISEGFQGEDGRTTIFDYWGVTEFQQWVNGGKYNLDQLTSEQKKLRAFYENLNHFVLDNEAVYAGEFYDLQYANIDGQSYNYDKNCIYSYLRYTDKQKLLFIYNFNRDNSIETSVRIPQNTWTDFLKLDNTSKYFLKPVFPDFITAHNIKTAEITSTGVQIELPRVSVVVFEIVENQR
jgi:1,4-alpha-glucan branching enzyme